MSRAIVSTAIQLCVHATHRAHRHALTPLLVYGACRIMMNLRPCCVHADNHYGCVLYLLPRIISGSSLQHVPKNIVRSYGSAKTASLAEYLPGNKGPECQWHPNLGRLRLLPWDPCPLTLHTLSPQPPALYCHAYVSA